MLGNRFSVFRFDDVEVREREFSLVKAGAVLPVEPKAFRVLLILLRNPGKLIGKEELLNAVWGDAAVTENSLTRSIALLRKLLGDETRNPRYIETVATVGYRFICKVEVAEDESGVVKPAGETPGSSTAADAAVIFLEEPGRGVGGELTSGQLNKDGRKRLARRALSTAAVLAIGIAAPGWYLHRPLPPPRITAYTQLTHDGHSKDLVGTDGNRIYLSSPYQGGVPTAIGQVAVSGGVVAPIPVELPDGYQVDRLADVSRDGSAFLVGSSVKHSGEHPQLWNVRVLGGSLRRMPDAWSAAFSPDGKTVAYQATDGDIWLMQSDGTGAHKLAPGGAEGLAWSPDGTLLRFTRNFRLWEISSNGSNLRQLFPNWNASSRQCCGRWTSDGRFFVFLGGESVFMSGAVQPGSEGGDIWALDERRGLIRRPSAQPVQLTTGPTRWGPPIPGDGKAIFSQGSTPRGELSRYDAQTKQLQPFLGGISVEGVTFSKDGRSVAYVSFPENTLWRANRDGSNPVQLTDPPMKVFLPGFSPDGTQIVFSDFSSPGHVESYIVPSEGGRPRRIIPEDQGQEGDPSWSPDGRKIVFDIGDVSPSHEIRVLDLDSHQVTTVPGSDGLYSPRWSPDGRYIAALLDDSSQSLKIFDFGTQRWSTPSQVSGLGFPVWSSDSQWIYFGAASDQGNRGIYRIRANGGEAQLVVDLKNLHWAGWFGTWFGLDPTDAPLLLRDVGGNDIYALTLEEK
jgi:Tol biopolymer transport system component/DNA-binding winged helix-turn-helix (wHTH) protein